MKRKGIPLIEQHVEKLVVGVVAAALLAVVAMQFLLTPNWVDVDGRALPPGEVFSALGDEADQLLGRLSDETPVLPSAATPDLSSRLVSAVRQDGLPGRLALSAPVGEVLRLEVSPPDETMSLPVMAMRVPAPGAPVTAARWATADPRFVEAFPRVRTHLLRASQPYDIAGVSVETTFGGSELAELLRGAEAGRSPIPPGWWVGGVEIVRVEVERQSRRPGTSGWSDPEAVERPFWSPGVFERLSDGGAIAGPADIAGSDDLARVVSMAERQAESILRPEPLPTIAGPAWRPPTRIEDALVELERVERIPEVRLRLARIDEQLERLSESERPGASATRRDRPGGRRDRPQQRDPGRDRDRDTVDPRTRQIEDLEAERTALEEELDDLMVMIGEQEAEASTPGSAERLALLESETVPIWTHDLSVEPGFVYRYRVRVLVNSPLFGRADQLPEEPAELRAQAAEPLVASPWSAWSEPVEVDRAEYFFVTSATDEAEIGRSAVVARAEVYRIFYGYYRRSDVRFELGVPVTGRITLPEDIDLFTYDLTALTPEAIDGLERWVAAQEAAEAASSEPAGPGRDEPAEPVEVVELPAAFERLPRRLPLEIGSVLLDVVPVPGGELIEGIPEVEVLLYDPIENGVVRRAVGDESADERYARMRLSELRGRENVPAIPAPAEGVRGRP